MVASIMKLYDWFSQNTDEKFGKEAYLYDLISYLMMIFATTLDAGNLLN